MKKRIVAIILLICIAVSALTVNASAAYAPRYTEYADTLFGLDMFRGSGIQADGTPAYDLDRGITRAECIVMLLRLLGEEYIAEASDCDSPFKDIKNHWATNYIEYAYEKGYTNGTGANTFSPDGKVNGKMYLTFLLRALGYDDAAGDFNYNTAYEKAAEVGLCPKGTYTTDATFYRDDCVYTSYNALCAKVKNSDMTLIDALVEKGTVEEDKAEIFRLKGDPANSDGLLDLSVFYHVGLGYSQIKNLFPKGYWRDDCGYVTSSFATAKFGQINFQFDNGTNRPSTGAEGRLRQIMVDTSRTYDINDLAKAIGGEIYSDRIEAKLGGSTLTIYPQNGIYNPNSTFVYENEPFEEPIAEEACLLGYWMGETHYDMVGFDITEQSEKKFVVKTLDSQQKYGTRSMEFSDVTFTSKDGVNYVSERITDWGGNVWQFAVKVDVSSLYTKLHCTCESLYIDPYLPPNYAFASEFELTLFV